MRLRSAVLGRQPNNRGGLVAPRVIDRGAERPRPDTTCANVEESMLDPEPDDTEGTTGDSRFHRIGHDRLRHPPPHDALSPNAEMLRIEAAHALSATEAPILGRMDFAEIGPPVPNSEVGT
jgi:hypothetical protein